MFAHVSTPGELPKELGQLVNLTIFDVDSNAQYENYDDYYDVPIPGTGFTGELYAPAYARCMFC